jgi:hypothetical protein
VLQAAEEDTDLKRAAVTLASRVDAETDRNPERLRRHWESCVLRARQDATRGAASGAELMDVMEQIKRKREAHSSLGADRRVYPRRG